MGEFGGEAGGAETGKVKRYSEPQRMMDNWGVG